MKIANPLPGGLGVGVIGGTPRGQLAAGVASVLPAGGTRTGSLGDGTDLGTGRDGVSGFGGVVFGGM